MTVCLFKGIILGRRTTLLDTALEAALEAALVYGDMFLDNGRGDDSDRNRHVMMVSVPGQKGLLVCIQEQSDVLGYDFRRCYRCGMKVGVNTCCGGIILPSENVNNQIR